MAINDVISRIDAVISDSSVPRNVKRAAEEAKKALTNACSDIHLKKNEAISILSEVSEDSNLPMQGRTKLWGILSALEALDTGGKAPALGTDTGTPQPHPL